MKKFLNLTLSFFNIFLRSFDVKSIVIASLFLIITGKVSNAQSIDIQMTEPQNVVACDSNLFQTSFNHSSTFSIKIKPRIITGNGSTFSLSCQDSIPVFPIRLIVDTVSSPDVSAAVFQSADTSWVINVMDTGSISLNYFLLVDCSIIQYTTFNNSLNLLQTWTCDGCGFLFDINNLGSNTLTSSNIKYPRLTDISNVNFNGSYGNTSVLDFTFRNNGNTVANIRFSFDPDPLNSNCDAVDSDTLLFGVTDSSGIVTNWSQLIPNQWTAVTVPVNRNLVIRDSITVRDCLVPCSSQKTSFVWRCAFTETTDTLLCKNCLDQYISTYALSTPSNQKAKLLLERLAPIIQVARADHSCPGTYVNWRFKVTNTGLEDIPATDLSLFFYGQVDRYSDLSLIPLDSISVDLSGCPACTIDTSYVLKTNNLCTQIASPLLRWDAILRQLGGGESIEFSFATYKCSSEDNTLWNTPKYFNQWRVGCTATDSCGATVDQENADPANNPFQGPPGNVGPISSHMNSASADLNLNLEFITTVTDITVPKDSVFGPSVNLQMNLQGMFPTVQDYQILGCSFPDSSLCELNGFLLVQIHCQTGLRVENIYSDVWLNHTDAGTMLPVYAYQNVVEDTCQEGDYYFYFDLRDSAAFDMINSGQLYFTLQSCCGNLNDEPTEYSVRFSLLPNPDSCFTLGTAGGLQDPPSCSGCQWLPLSFKGSFINVHCPGCRPPGMIIDSYKMERLTYGYQDSNNDRVADLPLTTIQKDSAYYNGHPLRPFVSMHGDLIQDIMVAHLEPGVLPDSTDTTGYTYQQMIQTPSSAVLDYLQLSRRIGESSSLSMNLQPVEMFFYIDIPHINGDSCLDCAEYDLINGNFKTIQMNYADSTTLSTFLSIIPDSLDNYYFFSFDVDSGGPQTLFDNFIQPDSTQPFTAFYEGQQYRLKVIYRNCGNFLPSNITAAESDDGFRESVIQNNMWMSGKDQGYDAYPANVPLMPYVLPNDTVDSTFSEGNLFICEVYGGRHYFVSNSAYNRTVIPSLGDLCKRQILSEAFRVIGGDGKTDRFPFEFRAPVFHPEQFTIQHVPGFVRSNPRMLSTFRNVSLNPLASDTVFLNIGIPPNPLPALIGDSIFPAINCVTQIPISPGDTNLYTGDQFGTVRVLMDLLPDTCQIGYTFVPDTSFSVIDFSDYSTECGAVSDTLICGSLNFSASNSAYSVLQLPYPLLTMAVNDSITYTNQVCWDLEFSNPLVDSIAGTTYGASTYAPYVYLIPPDNNNIPGLSNWEFTFTGNNTILPDSNGIFHISTSLATSNSSSITGQLCANVLTCDSLSGIPIKWGWNCLNYPTDADSLCYSESDTLQFAPPSANLNTEGKVYFAPVTLCDTLTFGAKFVSDGDGVIFTDSLTIGALPAFMNVTGIYLTDCGVSGIPMALPGTGPVWVLSDSMLMQHGYPGGYLNPDDSLCVRITATLECGYQNVQTLPDIILKGHDFCESDVSASANFSGVPVQVDSTISNCGTCFTIEKMAVDSMVIVGDTTGFIIVVCAFNSQGQTLSLNEQFPYGFVPLQPVDSITVPAIGCDTLLIYGTYSYSGNCTDSNMFNTATIYFSGDSLSDTACLPVYPICAAAADTIVADSTFTSNVPALVDSLTIFLAGRLYVDDAITFKNCTIFVNTGGQIILQLGGSIILDSTLIQGCDFMWQGIMTDTLTSVAVTNGSTIRDANRAVEARDRSTLKITHSAFEDNVWGIYVPANSSGNNIPHTIYGNRFGLFAASLKSAYPGQAPFGSMPYAGIEVNDVVMTIGSNEADSNWFYNMNTGILGHRSALKVLNNKFSQVQIDTALSNPSVWDGTAIASLGDHDSSIAGKLIVRPVVSGAWTIENCREGIYTDYSELDVFDVKMTRMQTGIFSTRCTDMLSSIVERCVIEADYIGIDWQNNNGSANMLAEGNSIYMTGAYTYGILMQELNTAATANYRINSNYVEMNDGMFGITGMNLFRSAVTSNIVKLSGTSSPLAIGIAYKGGLNNVIHCNIIDGDNATDTTRAGIAVHISESTQVICNRTDETGFGVFFGGINPVTTFRGNTMIDHFNGLRLNSVAVIDTQSHAGNRWVGTYANFGAVNMNDSVTQNLLASLFEVNPTPDLALLPSTPASNPNNVGWFDVLPNGAAFACDSIYACHFDHEEEKMSSEELMMAIANDSILTMDFIPESKSMAKDYLYEKLVQDSVLLYSSQTFVDFKSENEVSATGYLYEVKTLIKGSNTNDSISNLLITNYTLLKQFTDSIFILDSLENINSNPLNILQRQLLIQAVANLNSTISNLLGQQSIENTGKLNLVLQMNSTIQPEETPESNEKFINQMEILYKLGGINAISTYQNQILSITVQCPFKGGKAVYRARVLAALFNSSIVFYDDLSVCASEGIYRESINLPQENPQVKLIPNPADESVSIITSGFGEGICKLQIKNSINQITGSFTFNCLDQSFKIDTSKLSPGIYTVHITIDNRNHALEKLIIIR